MTVYLKELAPELPRAEAIVAAKLAILPTLPHYTAKGKPLHPEGGHAISLSHSLHWLALAIVLNQPSMDKFLPMVKKGGIVLYDSNGVSSVPERDDINVFRVDAVDESVKMNNTKVFNIIVLGGLLKVAPMVDITNIEEGLKKSLPERHHKLIPLNLEALKRGMEIVVHERVAK